MLAKRSPLMTKLYICPSILNPLLLAQRGHKLDRKRVKKRSKKRLGPLLTAGLQFGLGLSWNRAQLWNRRENKVFN